jgi:enediyne biosynthesis protein E4
VTSLNAPIELWWNRSPRENPTRHWLQVRLTGTRSNRSAIGAEVRCSSGGRLQVRTVSGSVGYGSTSDLTVHFGLGGEKEAKLEIRWPSGKTQVMPNVPADQRIAITESTS